MNNQICVFCFSETDDCDLVKRTICTDPDNDEYSMKATRTLYIGNLQSEISYNELRETYSAYGDIIVCIVLLKEDKKENQGNVLFCFSIGIGNQTSDTITTSITICICSICGY